MTMLSDEVNALELGDWGKGGLQILDIAKPRI